MISLARAAKCPGRRVRHVTGSPSGRIMGENVTPTELWVETDDGETHVGIPEDWDWVPLLNPEMSQAIRDWEPYENPQIGFTPWLWKAHDEFVPFPNFGVVYSSSAANDDELDHPLYAVPHNLRRVQLLRFNANPDIAREIEEILGWEQP